MNSDERSNYLYSLGILLQDLRRRRGLTQEEMAKYLGCSRQHISSIERGNDVSTWEIMMYADTCGVSIAAILDDGKELCENTTLWEKYKKLPDEHKKIVNDMIFALTTK